MNSLIEKYNSIISKLREIDHKIAADNARIAEIQGELNGSIPKRIQHLNEQIHRIDDYLLKILGFQDLAKQHLTSLNALTIEAPPGYRVNLNRLRNWAMMIDPSSSDDPYAQRVYLVAKCDEFFLKRKREEFLSLVERLKAERNTGLFAELEQLRAETERLNASLESFASGEEFADFADEVYSANTKYRFLHPPTEYVEPPAQGCFIAPGAYAASLKLSQEQLSKLKANLGEFLDDKGGRILLPVELSADKEYVISVVCTPSRRAELDRGIQNLLLNTLQAHPIGTHKIFMIDAARFNTQSIRGLRQLEGSYSLEAVPRNAEQLTSTLEKIVSGFSDVDEIIGSCDSVSEYNASVSSEKRLPTSTVVIYGYTALDGDNKALADRILTGFERYGVSLIIASYADDQNKGHVAERIPDYARYNAVNISMMPGNTTIQLPDSDPRRFTWFTFSGDLGENYIRPFLEYKPSDDAVGNDYTKRYAMADLPRYTRAYKKIELPFGIDGKDEAHSLSFENENFAAYLMGASRSGKSTMIHTLIAGLIRNFHPDNLELWLADFKQLEFKRYMKHTPPHVKYVLLDESPELIYDLIDRLTDKMMERQRLFARLGVQRIDQVDLQTLSAPLPVIFVILDEFSIMSQSIAESQIYKLKLQNILAKGAALGIKFLFSSQTFTTGVPGLTPTARAQIQQRIAMKGSRDEISETLELSVNLRTEQVRNWMDALPPHYALVKSRTGPDTPPQVKRYLVMYIPDYSVRDSMIEQLNGKMDASDTYLPDRLDAYVDKHPVMVDGNTFDMFDVQKLNDHIRHIRSSADSDLCPEDKFVVFGTPRLMTDIKASVLSAETRENILLISRSAEQALAVSIMLSVMKSYKEQFGKVEIWAYPKNRVYTTYKQLFSELGFELTEGMDAVCDKIYGLKQDITAKKTSSKLIVLLGIDRICMDFDFVDTGAAESAEKPAVTVAELNNMFIQNGAVVQSEEEERKRKFAVKWRQIKEGLIKKYESEGKTPDEIKQLLSKDRAKLRVEFGIALPSASPAPAANSKPQPSTEKSPNPKKESKSHTAGSYNAAQDFVYIIKQGSRLGYHFLLNLNSLADLKATGLKKDYFRYKLAFQLPIDDSRDLYNSKIASSLPEHICQFDDTIEQYSFRPYLHKGISWDGWYVSDDGKPVSPYE